MKPFPRSERVAGLIQQALSEILRKSIKDPRLEMTTISAVKMSSDLKIAKIYYATAAGKKSKEEVAAGFQTAAGFIRRSLARQVNLRYMPELKFYFDESFDYGAHIETLLKSLKQNYDSHNTSFEE